MITMDIIVVGAIVAAAFFFAFRKLYTDVSGKVVCGCDCGCGGGCGGGCGAAGKEFCNEEKHLH